MSPQVTLQQVEEVPADSRVCHYDELEESAKERFPVIADGETGAVDRSTATQFRECDLVKYTDYYEISLQ